MEFDYRTLDDFDLRDKRVLLRLDINVPLDPGSKRISREPLRRLFQYIPAKVAICRVYAPTHRFDQELGRAARQALALEGVSESFETNV